MTGEWWVRPDGLWRPDGVSLEDLRLFRACNYAARASDMRARYKEWNPNRVPLYRDTRLPLEAWAQLVTTSAGDLSWGMYLMDPRRWARTVAKHVRAAYAGEEVTQHPELVYALGLLGAPDRWEAGVIRNEQRRLRVYWRPDTQTEAEYGVKQALWAVDYALWAERRWAAGVDATAARSTQRSGQRAAWSALRWVGGGDALMAAWEAARAPAPVDTNNKEAV